MNQNVEEFNEIWTDLINKYFLDDSKKPKNLENFSTQFPKTKLKINPYESLYYLFEHKLESIQSEKKKCNYTTYLNVLLKKYNVKAYVDLYCIRDFSFSPINWGVFVFMASRVKTLKNFLTVLNAFLRIDGENRVYEKIEFLQLFWLFYLDIADESQINFLQKMDKKLRGVLENHKQISDFTNWKKDLKDKGEYSYPTLRELLKKIRDLNFRFLGHFNFSHIGINTYAIYSNPPINLSFEKNFIRNQIFRGGLRNYISMCNFYFTDELFPTLLKKIKHQLPSNYNIEAYKVKRVFWDIYSFDMMESNMHFTKNGELILNEDYLINNGNKIMKDFENRLDNTELIKEMVINPIPKEEITNELLRFIWTHQQNPLASLKEFNLLSGLPKYRRKELFQKYWDKFDYVPTPGSSSIFFGVQYLITLEKNREIYTWEEDFIKELFKSLPFKMFTSLKPIQNQKTHKFRVSIWIPRNSISTFLKYLNHIENNFYERFKFKVYRVVYQDTTLSTCFLPYLDEEKGNFQKYIRELDEVQAIPLENLKL